MTLTDVDNNVTPVTTSVINAVNGDALTSITTRVDGTGKLISVAMDQTLPPGRTEFVWSAVDDRGRSIPNGVYFVRADVFGQRESHRVVLAR